MNSTSPCSGHDDPLAADRADGDAVVAPISTARFIVESGLAAQFAGVIEPTLVDLGFRLVRVAVLGKEGKTLQIMAERPDGTISIDDCETISKQVSPVLDVNDMLPGAYRLEVSSPGIDRPLVRPSDFVEWAGYEAKIELVRPVDGRKRFKGSLEGFDNGEVLMECDVEGTSRQLLGFAVDLIADARLVLTDDLIREALTRAKRAKSGRPGDGVELDPAGDVDVIDGGDDHPRDDPDAPSHTLAATPSTTTTPTKTTKD